MFITAKITLIFMSLTAVQMYDFHLFTTNVVKIENINTAGSRKLKLATLRYINVAQTKVTW